MNFDPKDIEIARNAFAPLRGHFEAVRGTRRIGDEKWKLQSDNPVGLLLNIVKIAVSYSDLELLDDPEFQKLADIPVKQIFSAVHKEFFGSKSILKNAGEFDLLEQFSPKDVEQFEAMRYNEYYIVRNKLRYLDAILIMTEKSMRDESYSISTLTYLVQRTPT